METPFFGGSYPGFSNNLANDRTINLYPELVETKQGKQIGALYSTPGQRALLTLPNFGVGTVMGPCRGSRTMATTNKMIQVYGNTVMTVDTNNITVLLGHINTSTGPVDIIDNGTQVAVSDGYQLWAYTLLGGVAGSIITTLPSAPGVLVIQDGFGLTNILGTDQFYQSNLNDLTTWGALNFSSADAEPSPIIGMATLFRQVWIFKQNTTEVWNNVGGAGFTFQRMQGVYLQVGCQAPYSVATSGERVIWLGQNALGTSSVFMNNGYESKPISTHAVDYKIIQYQQASQKGIIDAIGFVYNQGGHTFYVLTFPGGNATWVYDLTTQLWHERGEWLGGKYNRWDPSSYCYYNKQHVVGSGTGAQLSVLDLAYPVDDLPSNPTVNPKRWFRRWRALAKPMNEPVRFGSLKIDMQTGVSILPLPKSLLAAITITGSLGSHYVGVPLVFGYTVTAKFQPYTCVISSGSLPPGLTINSQGIVTGTPTATGNYTWSVTAFDFYGNIAIDNDSASIFGVTWWLTGISTSGLWQNPTLPSWAGSIATSRSPFINLRTSTSSGGYIQPNSTSIIGASVNGAVEQVTNLLQTGVIATTVTQVDSSGDLVLNFYAFGSILIMCFQNNGYYYTSLNNGVSWVRVVTPSGFSMNALGRTAAGVWFAEISSGGSGGLYYSTDILNPVTWVFSGTGITSNATGQMLSGSNVSMKTGSVGQVFTSVDGKSWASGASGVYPGTNSNSGDVNTATNTFIYASNSDNSVIYRSASAGVNWATINVGATGAAVGVRYYANVNTWVASFTDGIFYSVNDGLTWSKASLPAGVTTSFAIPVRHAP